MKSGCTSCRVLEGPPKWNAEQHENLQSEGNGKTPCAASLFPSKPKVEYSRKMDLLTAFGFVLAVNFAAWFTILAQCSFIKLSCMVLSKKKIHQDGYGIQDQHVQF